MLPTRFTGVARRLLQPGLLGPLLLLGALPPEAKGPPPPPPPQPAKPAAVSPSPAAPPASKPPADALPPRFVLAGPTSWVQCLSFSPDGRHLAAGGNDQFVRLADPATGQWRTSLHAHEGVVTASLFTPDGKSLFTTSNDLTAKLWDAATRKRQRTLWGHTKAIWCAALSPDGQTLATGSEDGTVRLWDAETGKDLRVIRAKTGIVRALAFAPDGNRLATGGEDGTVRLWDPENGREKFILRGHQGPVPAVAFSPDGKVLASGGRDATVRLWDRLTGQDLGILRGHVNPVLGLAFSPDSRTLATAGGAWPKPQGLGEAKLWELASRGERAILGGHQGSVLCVAFAPDGKTLATGCGDNAVRVWDLAGGRRGPSSAGLTAKDLEGWWAALSEADASKAAKALWALAGCPHQAIPYLKGNLRPASVESARVARLLEELDHDDFAVRERASRELLDLADVAEPALRKALANPPSVEVQKRIEQLFEQRPKAVPSRQQLRSLRAVELLERIGSAEAQQVLQTVAGGAPDARLTQDAKASLQRLSRGATAGP
jgi:hypothetical protein